MQSFGVKAYANIKRCVYHFSKLHIPIIVCVKIGLCFIKDSPVAEIILSDKNIIIIIEREGGRKN